MPPLSGVSGGPESGGSPLELGQPENPQTRKPGVGQARVLSFAMVRSAATALSRANLPFSSRFFGLCDAGPPNAET